MGYTIVSGAADRAVTIISREARKDFQEGNSIFLPQATNEVCNKSDQAFHTHTS